MADISMITDDEYVSPDEFNEDFVKTLQKQINELSKQLEKMKLDRDEAHRYINDVSAKIASHAEVEKEVKRLTILNHDLENRLQAEDKAYVKLWKEVSPSKDNGSGEKTLTEHKEESDTKAGLLNEKTLISQADNTVQQNQDMCVKATVSVSKLTEEIRRKNERIHELENEVKTLKTSLQETLKIKDKYKKTLEKLRDEKQSLSEETSRQLTQRDNKICKTEEKLRLMTVRRDQLEKDLEKAKEELDLPAKKMTEVDQGHKSTLAGDGKAMSSELDILQDVVTLRKELGSAEGRLTLVTERKDELEKNLEKTKDELNVMAKKLTESNQVHKSTLAENEMAISSASESLQLSTRKVECDDMQLKNEELEKRLKEKEQSQVARDDELHALELKNEKLEKLLNEKEDLIAVTSDDELYALELKKGERIGLLKEKEYITDSQNDSQVYFDFLTVQPPKTRKIIEIGLHSLRSGMGRTMTDRVTTGLQKLLQDRLLREKIELHIKPCKTIDDDTNGPLFILCLAKSIIGTKVHALEGITGNKDTVLIIIYYTDTDTKDSLSLPIPSFRLYGSELRPLGGTMDMMFSGSSGLYDCVVNNSAVERMTTFLKKY